MDQYYKILGLEVGANLSEIEVKYHLLMEEFNPFGFDPYLLSPISPF